MDALVRGRAFATDSPGRHSLAGRIGRGHKAAAAVRADVVQLGLDAVGAERAFIAADPRSTAAGGKSLSQYSQFGRSCSAMTASSGLGVADHRKTAGRCE